MLRLLPRISPTWRLLGKNTKISSTTLGENRRKSSRSSTSEAPIPFAHPKIGTFFQDIPTLGNQYNEDTTLRSFLKRNLPKQMLDAIEPDLQNFGVRVATDLYDLHLECDRLIPELRVYNAWGRRADEVITCDAWKQMKREAAKEGIISIGYDRKQWAEYSRLYQTAKLFMYSPSSGLYSCPLAMTDGAACIIESLNPDVRGQFEHAYQHLTSRDPDQFWTSGQWMTERGGGSDVGSGTETMAVLQDDGGYKLYGYKWFTSATDSDMTFTLARCVDQHGNTIPGSKGLSLFYLEVRDENGQLNNIQVQRLKDKLGTRQVPTAELLLDGTRAFRASEEGHGVSSIALMLTMTRIHNAISSAAAMRRIVNFARDYSQKRRAFGKILKDHQLHIRTLSKMEVEARAATLVVLEAVRLLGLLEVGKATEDERNVLRLLSPLIKLYTAKQAVSVVSEGLECFGGMGYLEDTGLPLILRDAQVLPIWEGTTNILSLDTLRALVKTNGAALVAFHQALNHKLDAAGSQTQLEQCCDRLRQAANQLIAFASKHPDKLEVAARDFAYSLSRVYMGSLLVEHASWENATASDVLAAQRWCEQSLDLVTENMAEGHYGKDLSDAEYALVMDGYNER